MNEKRIAPYGSWKSPITSDLIVQGAIRLGQTAIDGADVCWIEMRPNEGGRSVIVRHAADGTTSDITPREFNARTRVHEYGGGDYAVAEGIVYFSNFSDQRLYKQSFNDAPAALTPESNNRLRYADMTFDGARKRLVCVREDHRDESREAVNAIVAVNVDARGDDEGRVLISGHDFYSSPRVSPDGKHLAWLAWNHPNMPWDGCELWTAEFNEAGALSEAHLVAGSDDESIFQPEWSPDGRLYFVSDRSNWWNLYRLEADGAQTALCPMDAEFGQPQWVFGLSTYAFVSKNKIACARTERDGAKLALLDTKTLALETLALPFADIAYVSANESFIVFLGGSPVASTAIVKFDLASQQTEILKRASDLQIDAGYLSAPRRIEFPTENGLTAHAIFYPPRNKDFAAPEGELPPLLVESHGGPTSAASSSFNLSVQYWTSRGFAVADVNYGGSSGYGRKYRSRLNGAWGIVDVDDCCNVAKFLAAQGEVDPLRSVIDGRSAGGYTTLAALTFRETFRAGASHFGVSDLAALARDTHKFESRYLDRLIGKYPEEAEIYQARSPIHHTERLSCPVIFFQGLEDKVVPPSQAEMMVEALRAKGLPVAYVAFEGEQHGFRRAENIKRSLDGELYFYSRVLNFPLADEIGSVPIENQE